MIKMVFLCRRRPDLTRAEYARRILDGHVPLALAHHPRMRRYVVNVAEGTPPGAAEVDSLPALYFATLDDFRERLYDSPEGQAIIHADVQRFMGGADAYATREQVHRDAGPAAPLGARSPGVKLVCPIRRRAGTSRARFAAAWREEHVPAALERFPEITRYATSLVEERVSETGEDWDGFEELHFATPEDASRLEALPMPCADRVLRYPVSEWIQK